jgi:hypothetical protein
MWEASWGIIAVIVIMFGVGLLASPARRKTRVRSRQEFEIAGALGTGGTAATNLNTESDQGKLNAALKQAAQGVQQSVQFGAKQAPPTPAENAVGGR